MEKGENMRKTGLFLNNYCAERLIFYKLPHISKHYNIIYRMRRLTGFIILSLFIGISIPAVNAQNKALVIIDIQDFYFPGGDLPLDNPIAAAFHPGNT